MSPKQQEIAHNLAPHLETAVLHWTGNYDWENRQIHQVMLAALR